MGASRLDNLRCYQLGMELALEIDRDADILRNRSNHALSNQIRRASISVVANIAEGFGRSASKELARFVDISRGSTYEVQTFLVLAHRLGYLDDAHHDRLQEIVSETLRVLTAFHKYLRTAKAPYLS